LEVFDVVLGGVVAVIPPRLAGLWEWEAGERKWVHAESKHGHLVFVAIMVRVVDIARIGIFFYSS